MSGSTRSLSWLPPVMLAALALSLPCVARRTRADDEATALERRVKAAYLYKFAGYVEWPAGTFANPEAPLTIAVVGDPSLASELSRITARRTSSGHSVKVLQPKPFEPLEGVHMMFVGAAESARLAAIIRGAESRPILVVTESERALEQGSMINFMLSDGRVRFEVDLTSVERSGLMLSSRLLAVARSVYTGTP